VSLPPRRLRLSDSLVCDGRSFRLDPLPTSPINGGGVRRAPFERAESRLRRKRWPNSLPACGEGWGGGLVRTPTTCGVRSKTCDTDHPFGGGRESGQHFQFWQTSLAASPEFWGDPKTGGRPEGAKRLSDPVTRVGAASVSRTRAPQVRSPELYSRPDLFLVHHGSPGPPPQASTRSDDVGRDPPPYMGEESRHTSPPGRKRHSEAYFRPPFSRDPAFPR